MVLQGKEMKLQPNAFGYQNVVEHQIIGSTGELNSALERVRKNLLNTSVTRRSARQEALVLVDFLDRLRPIDLPLYADANATRENAYIIGALPIFHQPELGLGTSIQRVWVPQLTDPMTGATENEWKVELLMGKKGGLIPTPKRYLDRLKIAEPLKHVFILEKRGKGNNYRTLRVQMS